MVHASSTGLGLNSGANITVTVMGGSGNSGGGNPSASGGIGASVSLNDAISGDVDPSAALQLSQTAVAGNGGATLAGSPTGGASGNATSQLSVSQEATALNVLASAVGGSGGGLQVFSGIGVAFHGGTAFTSALANSLNNGVSIAEAYSRGGIGGAGIAKGMVEAVEKLPRRPRPRNEKDSRQYDADNAQTTTSPVKRNRGRREAARTKGESDAADTRCNRQLGAKHVNSARNCDK